MWRHLLHFWSASWVLKSYSDAWQKKFILMMMMTLKIWDWAIAVIQKMKMNIKNLRDRWNMVEDTVSSLTWNDQTFQSYTHPDDNLKVLSLIAFSLHLSEPLPMTFSTFAWFLCILCYASNSTVCDITAWWIPFLWSKIRWSCALMLYACPLSSHCAFIHC